mgnify:CR=1 FL=1
MSRKYTKAEHSGFGRNVYVRTVVYLCGKRMLSCYDSFVGNR